VISLDSITNTTLGNAEVAWTASGDFPNGFKVMYSQTVGSPTLSDTVVTVASGSAISATITGDPGATYHVRICKYDGSACVIYSNAMDITFTADTASLTMAVADTSSGNASVSWTPTGSFPEGYKVLMSATNDPPLLTTDVVATESNEATHTAPITGTPGTTYHIAVCKTYGSICSAYSATTDFIFGKINITSFVDVSSGVATINWTDSGTFADGFKVLYAAGHTPVYGVDSAVDVSNPAATSATISATPGTAYNFRVCKYNGVDGCVLDNGADVSFTLAEISNLVASDGASEGTGHLAWDAVGNFPSGFLYLISTTNTVPIIGDVDTSVAVLDSAPSARTGDISITPGESYYIRVCQATSASTCIVYSNTVYYTFSSSLALGISGTTNDVTLNWTGPTSTSYNIYRGTSITGPFMQIGNVLSSVFTFDDTGITPAGTYYYQVCSFNSPNCTTLSNVVNYTVP
jgi:hypothetical protein